VRRGAPLQAKLDVGFKLLAALCALGVVVLLAGLCYELARNSRLAFSTFGWKFLTSQDWNPVTGEFGALSTVYGTLVSTAIAMLLAVPLGLAIALFLVELAPAWLSKIVGGGIELLAAVPSIIYGMWGLYVFAPYLADHIQPALSTIPLPLFQGPPMGIGMLSAGIILALMILPFITAVTRDVLGMVPAEVRESAYGVGGTTWEVTRKVMIPYGIRGIIGAGFLGLGRALGETMAVTFVIGNAHDIYASLYMPGSTIASTLANEFAEASEPIYLSSLIMLGLVLFALTLVVQVLAQLWTRRATRAVGVGL
jgi:phosphate transport system permease protein